MLNIIDKITSLFQDHKDKLPEGFGSVDEVKMKAQELLLQHTDTIDQVTEEIPGDADNTVVEQAREALK